MLSDSPLHLRAGESTDGQTLVDLVNAMADADQCPRLDIDAQHRLMRDAFQKKKFEVVFSEWQGKVVGFVSFFEGYSTFASRPTLFIDDLFVLSDYRGRHIAYELFRHALRESKRRECGRVEWRVAEANKDAFGFYERLHTNTLQGWVHYRLNYEEIQRLA